MPDGALVAFLGTANLSHVEALLADETISGLEAKLEAGRTPFLNHLKAAGLTALKDRQGLCNALSKAKREREAGGSSGGGVTAAAEPAVKHQPVKGDRANVDVFGTIRGAHKTAGVCDGFIRIHTKNENDTSGFNCYKCGKPFGEHADLGPAPPEEDQSYEFDLSSVAVDGRSAFGQLSMGHVQPATPQVSEAHLEMFAAGSDPLAAAMGTAQPGVAAPAADPLGLGQMGATASAQQSDDPLGLAQMQSDDPLGLAQMQSGLAQMMSPVGAREPPTPPPPPPLVADLPPELRDEIASKGVDVGSLAAMAAAGDKTAAAAALKAAGFKTGSRLKIEAALFRPSAAPAAPAPSAGPPYQVDFFGVKRGKSASCTRYEARIVQTNHCSGPSDTSLLNCVRCGGAPGAHDDLGAWQSGEPMLVNEAGQRFKSLSVVAS